MVKKQFLQAAAITASKRLLIRRNIMTKDDILTALKKILVDNFEIDEASVKLEATLYDELDLDSIDAVDLVVALQKLTGKKIKPEEFKAVRSINDVVEATYNLLQAG